MNDEIEMKGGSETKCKPQYSERMLNVFDPHLSAPDEKTAFRICASKPGEICKHLAGVTIQPVIPVGLCYLTFVCENKQRNHYNWHESFKEVRLRKAQHY